MRTRTAARPMPNDLFDAAQQVWLAGLGVIALAQEESGRLLQTLVDAGRQVEKVLPSPAAALKGATQGAESLWVKLQAMIDCQITGALHRLGVPTKEEVDLLTKRIEELTESIDALRMRS